MASAAPFDWTRVVDYARREEIEYPRTQYELPGVTLEEHGGEAVPVVVPPLWHAIVTAKLTVPRNDARALQGAQRRLQAALAEIEQIYPLRPQGIYAQVAYGLPYLRNYIPPLVLDRYMPRVRAHGNEGDFAIIDSIKYPKDPPEVILEQNDVCFHFKSDYKEHIDDVVHALFYAGEYELNGIPATQTYVGDLFSLTSIRRGFLGRNMPKLMAERLRIPGADKIPAGAELFMGFTSSHLHGLAQGNLPSFETIPGYSDQTPDSYFAHGTMMHLSHILIDLEAWYQYGYRDRLHRMFNPRRAEAEGTLSPGQAPETSTFQEQLRQDAQEHQLIGHNAQMQFLSRVEQETTTVYGEKLRRGTTIFLRQDFDTVENPFEFWSEGTLNPTPRAGVHFVGFAASAQLFERIRREMDGVELQRQYNLPDENIGFTKFLVTTHRQNYLLPPRAHRSLPLAEFAA